ncbi:MAG TPA: hypothetical protein VJB35_00990 [Candidatus Nanoarchaeia archaeon]|nr:hypothetical protein [Candidatus Nanoarchaeia archaeon]
MDLFQVILGLICLLIGSMASYKNRDTNKIILGLFLIIIGITLLLGGFGIKI